MFVPGIGFFPAVHKFPENNRVFLNISGIFPGIFSFNSPKIYEAIAACLLRAVEGMSMSRCRLIATSSVTLWVVGKANAIRQCPPFVKANAKSACATFT